MTALRVSPRRSSQARLKAWPRARRKLARYRVNAAGAVPTMWARVLKETELLARLDVSAFRRLTLGSAPMTMGLWDRIKQAFPGITITIGFGTTEAGPAVFGPHPDGIP